VKFVVKWNAGDPMEHEIREIKIYEVNECPADLLGHAGYRIDYDLARENQDDVYKPCTLRIDPVGIDVEVRAAVKKFLCMAANFFDLDDAPAASATFEAVSGERYSKMR